MKRSQRHTKKRARRVDTRSWRPRLQPGDVARCLACGCTDTFGCDEGCSWVLANARLRIGVCSNPACNTPRTVERYRQRVDRAFFKQVARDHARKPRTRSRSHR